MNKSILGIVAGSILAASCATASADTLTINTLTLQNVRVTGMADGVLQYISAGSRQTKKLSEITAIDFSRYPDYAKAEALMADDPAKAADLFGGLAGDVREDYLQPLMRLRASEAMDKAGRFERALEYYLEAVEDDDSDYFVSRAPSNVPTGADAAGAKAALTGAISRTRDAQVKAALQATLAKFARQAAADGNTETAADNGNAEPVDPNPTPDPDPVQPTEVAAEVSSVRLRTVTNLIENERYDNALTQINKMMSDRQAAGKLLPDLYYLRGLAEAGKGEHFTAALSLLRVPVHFPDHALALPALEQAGHQLKADGQADAARTVWERALDKADDMTTKRRLQEAISSL
jgi:tetratricopeptide (TPR) repeat protein